MTIAKRSLATPDETRTQEDNKDTARRFAQAYLTGDVGELRGVMVPDSFLSGHVEKIAEMTKIAFPEVSVSLGDVIAEGDKVAVAFTMTGVNSGPAFGMPPTGKQITVSLVAILRLKDGRVVSMLTHSDVFQRMREAAQA